MIKPVNVLDILSSDIKRKAKRYFLFISRSLPWVLGLLMGVCFFASKSQQAIGTVNITGIVNNFIETQAKSGLSNEDLRTNVQLFGKNLEKIMHRVSTKNKVVLFPAEAVIAGAKDYTLEVQQQLPMSKQLVPEALKSNGTNLSSGKISEDIIPKKMISEEMVLPTAGLNDN